MRLNDIWSIIFIFHSSWAPVLILPIYLSTEELNEADHAWIDTEHSQ